MKQRVYNNRSKAEPQETEELLQPADAAEENSGAQETEEIAETAEAQEAEENENTEDSDVQTLNEQEKQSEKTESKKKAKHGSTILQRIVYAPGFLGCYVGAYAERYSVTFLLALAGLVGLIVLW